VVIPEMNGRELVERLSFLRPEVTTLYVSGYTDDAVLGPGALSPGMAYLAKRFSPVALARKVRDVIDS
jgi:two-component SAPR family response regulator